MGVHDTCRWSAWLEAVDQVDHFFPYLDVRGLFDDQLCEFAEVITVKFIFSNKCIDYRQVRSNITTRGSHEEPEDLQAQQSIEQICDRLLVHLLLEQRSHWI